MLRRTSNVFDGNVLKYKAQLDDQGIVAIPNYFGEDDFKRIREEFESLDPFFETSYSAVLLPHVRRIHAHDVRVSSFFRNAFMHSPFIKNVAEAYLGCSYNLPLDPNLTNIYCLNDEEIRSPKNGGTNNLHIDAPVRTLKAFYYLTDTTVKNAALKYCLKSNKRTSLKRLWLEYKLSIRYALNKWNPDHKGEYSDDEPWVTVTSEEMKDHGLQETNMEVKANTLVFVDTGGFHRRGEFHSTVPRKTVEISFRSVDTLKNALLPSISLFSRPFSKIAAVSSSSK